jgi:hypothetical protein
MENNTMKTLFTIIIIALFSNHAKAETVEYLCKDMTGNVDMYVHEFTTETPLQQESILYDQCRNMERLFVGYPEK